MLRTGRNVALAVLLPAAVAISLLVGLPFATASSASVSALSVHLSTPAKATTEATYTVEFTTSANGTLVAGKSQVEVSAAPGTLLPTCATGFEDMTTSDNFANACSPVQGAKPGPHQVIEVPINVPAGHTVQMVFNGVTNAGPGRKPLQVSTTSDYREAKTRYAISPHVYDVAGVRGVYTPAHGTTPATYMVSFTTSVQGALVAGSGTVDIQAPRGCPCRRAQRRSPI